MTEKKETKPIRATLIELEVGEKTSFPAHQFSSVSSSCTNYGFEFGRKFKASKNRENNTVEVIRLA